MLGLPSLSVRSPSSTTHSSAGLMKHGYMWMSAETGHAQVVLPAMPGHKTACAIDATGRQALAVLGL